MNDHETARLMTKTLEDGLSELRGHPVRIREMQRLPFRDSSSFTTERLQVLLSGHERLDVFFKDLNPSNQLDMARNIRAPGLDRSRRELCMYKQVLPTMNLGTPQLYASLWDLDRGRMWLFMEYVGADRLGRTDDFQLWLAAARWAARFHAAVQDRSLDTTGHALNRDRGHYNHCAGLLESNLSQYDRKHRPVLSKALRRYRTAVDRLVELPRHLIHGEFYDANIMIRSGSPDEVLAVTDWETAALGSGCEDLASISLGLWTKEQRHAMWRAYYQQYQAETGVQQDWHAFCDDVGRVQLYLAVAWLGWWAYGDSMHKDRCMRDLHTVLLDRYPDG